MIVINKNHEVKLLENLLKLKSVGATAINTLIMINIADKEIGKRYNWIKNCVIKILEFTWINSEINNVTAIGCNSSLEILINQIKIPNNEATFKVTKKYKRLIEKNKGTGIMELSEQNIIYPIFREVKKNFVLLNTKSKDKKKIAQPIKKLMMYPVLRITGFGSW